MNKLDKQLSVSLEMYLKEQNTRDYKRAQHAACYLSWELHFGPSTDHRLCERKYFAALNRLKNYIEQYIHTFYVDIDCDYVSLSEPEGYIDENNEWQEPYTESTYKLSSKESSKLLFGVASEYI